MSPEVAKQLRLLVVEDSDDDFTILMREVARGGYEPIAERVASAEALATALAREWDLMITDWLLPGFGGLSALELAAARARDMPCIVISGTPNEEAAVTALRAGALDFLSKDRPLRFVPAIERALREAAERRARVQAERELQISQERHHQGFLVAPEALLTYDVDNRKIVDANPSALALFGYTLDELRTLEIGELSPPTQPDGRLSRDAAIEMLERSSRGYGGAFDWTYRAKSGELIPTDARITKLPGHGESISRVTIIDLRERMRAEELRRHAVELELQNRRIQEANRLKSEFLANMSHELRTPLNAIIGFAELLHDGQVDPASPQHREFLGDILTSGRHLLQLINDVLDLAKVEAGKLDFRPEPFDIARVINEVVGVTRTTAAAKKIQVTTALDPTVARVVIDPNRLRQISYNYLSNALKFTPEGGKVIVRVVPESDTAFRLEVEDTGIGIAPVDLGKLFVEFQQLEAGAAKRHQGTGLGLALTRRLVEAQGGTVGVRSTQGAGSVFHAVLPRIARAEGTIPPPMLPRLGARTVLIVEDNARDRDVLIEALSGAGYSVEVAQSGGEAIAHCRRRTFDAVTLDLLLPDMSGLECLAALRADGRARTTPVIVVSVLSDAKVVAGFAVHDVLRKPVDRDVLVRSLERAGVRPDRAGGILVVDDDDTALRLMDATLAQLGFSAITRSTGKAALEAAERLKPTAVVLDLMMPEMDGVEFLDRFRRIPAHARTPVLIWTAKELSRAETAQLRESAQGVVSKNGNTPSTVVAQLRTLLGEAR